VNIVVDLDGVVVEYDFPRIVKDFFGVDLSKYAIYAYDLADVLGVAPVMINNMFKEQVYGPPNLIVGAVDTLRKWMDKYRVLIHSNRVKYMGGGNLMAWMDEYKIPHHSLYGNHEADYHIDDSPAKLMNVNAKVKLLYNQPWNKHCLNITGQLERVNNWQQIEEIVG
jgi:hypothetical protein